MVTRVGVARGHDGPSPANGGWFRIAGEVCAGEENAPGNGGAVPAVAVLKDDLPGGVDGPSIA